MLITSTDLSEFFSIYTVSDFSTIHMLTAIELILFSPILYLFVHYSLSILRTIPNKSLTTNIPPKKLVIIMSFRNEEMTLPLSLSPILDYIDSNYDSRLILIDSKSDDNSSLMARRIIEERTGHSVESTIFLSSKKGGKCAALNISFPYIENDEQVLLVDSDAIVSSVAIGKLRNSLSSEEIGCASGLERIRQDSGTFSRNYKIRSNAIRKYQSSISSSIVVEGSMLMFDPIRIGWNGFDESINADDAQISAKSIISGHRSVIVEGAFFKQITNSPDFQFSRSVRRGQGISSVLMKNPRLLIARGMFFETFRTWLLYIVIPWSVVMISFIASLSLVGQLIANQEIDGVFGVANSLFLLVLIFSQVGRSLFIGSVSMITAHYRIILGKSYSSWEPIR
jgi:glycosyltransferase involved in cell wall biosynthesis